MLGDLRVREWLPLLVTIAMLFVVVYAGYATMSRDWADLLGLAYLLASPGVYAAVKAVVVEAPDATPDVEVGA